MMGTMQDFPLTVANILRHGRAIFGESRVVTLEEGGRTRTKTFAEVAARAEQLAAALRELGIRPGDRFFCPSSPAWGISTSGRTRRASPT